ncbi:hypothetical protein ACJJTC_013940 [Scirpophaga incertulas]
MSPYRSRHPQLKWHLTNDLSPSCKHTPQTRAVDSYRHAQTTARKASAEKLRDLDEAAPVGAPEAENTGKEQLPRKSQRRLLGKWEYSLAATTITPPPHTPTIPKKDNYYVAISTTPDRLGTKFQRKGGGGSGVP